MTSSGSAWLNEALLGATIEIAAAARHDAKGYIDACQTHLVMALRSMESNPERARESIASADESLRDLSLALDRIALRRIRSPDQRQTLRVASAFEDAAALVLGSPESFGARIDSAQAEVEIRTVPYLLQMAFAELLRTTVFGFERGGRARARVLRLTCERQETLGRCRIVYVDTDSELDREVAEAILEDAAGSELSSFEDGGWRLVLAERILRKMGGGLSVLPSDAGVAFELIVPLYVDEEPAST